MSKQTYSRPPIVVAEDEHERLITLALSALKHAPGAVDLFVELSRARVVAALPAGVIGIGSTATFDYDGSHYRDFELVDPHQADIARQRISILTPVGAMLLGLSQGQSIEWTGPDGREHKVTIARVN